MGDLEYYKPVKLNFIEKFENAIASGIMFIPNKISEDIKNKREKKNNIKNTEIKKVSESELINNEDIKQDNFTNVKKDSIREKTNDSNEDLSM